MNFTDILGAVVNQGMTGSSGSRINNSMAGAGGLGGIGDILGSLAGGAGGASAGAGSSSGGLGDILGSLTGSSSAQAPAGSASSSGGLGDILGSVLGGSGGANNSLVTGGLGALAGALFGGGGSSVKGALGGSALALLGSLALKALKNHNSTAAPSGSEQLMAGLRAPQNDSEEREVQSLAELTIKAMFNAAKADGHIDQAEIERIIGKMAEDGLTDEEREYLKREAQSPLDTEGLIRAVPNQQVAAQIYAASLLAIEIDTDAERRYMQTLAQGLGLDSSVTSSLQAALGVN